MNMLFLLNAARFPRGKGKGGGRWAQHWTGCDENDVEAFEIDREGWTAAAKEVEGLPWHQGVLTGVEKFMTSWHEKQEGESHKPAIDRDEKDQQGNKETTTCLLYTSPSPRDRTRSRMPSSA